MANQVQHLSETEFRLDGHYCYLDHNNEWIAQPPLDSSETNQIKCFHKIIEQKKAKRNRSLIKK